ncbi:MAG: F0F1 ATP synthase subunit B [Alphaproteobacteria bacterium]|nr:F0F1 ATP synthase subunit B [Alphaproteobacteria bacterium]
MNASFWVAIAFVAFVIAVFKPIKRVLIGALDGRADKIRRELEDARKLREDATELLATYRQKHKNAMREAEDIVAMARAETERQARQAAEDLTQSLKRREERALTKIAKAEAQALAEVRAAAIEAAVGAARDVLQTKVDAATRSRLADQAIAELGRRL